MNQRGERSSICDHVRWAELVFFVGRQPGANGVMDKALRDHARAESELREAGGGPDLRLEIRSLEEEIQRLEAASRPCPHCRRPPSADVLAQRESVRDRLAQLHREAADRRQRHAEILSGLKIANAEAVGAIHQAIGDRLKGLASEASALIASASDVAREFPDLLPERLVEIATEAEIGLGLLDSFGGSHATSARNAFTFARADKELLDLKLRSRSGSVQAVAVG